MPRKPNSILSSINSPIPPLPVDGQRQRTPAKQIRGKSAAEPLPAPVSTPVADTSQPAAVDPVLAAIQLLTGKIDAFEKKLNAIEAGEVPSNTRNEREQQVPVEPTPLVANDTVNHAPARRVYNTPPPVQSSDGDTDAAQQHHIQYVQPLKPTQFAGRQTVVVQNFGFDNPHDQHMNIPAIEEEAESMLAAMGVSNVKTRPVMGQTNGNNREKRVVVTCERCHREFGRGKEWVTTSMLRSDGTFICNKCLDISQ